MHNPMFVQFFNALIESFALPLSIDWNTRLLRMQCSEVHKTICERRQERIAWPAQVFGHDFNNSMHSLHPLLALCFAGSENMRDNRAS